MNFSTKTVSISRIVAGLAFVLFSLSGCTSYSWVSSTKSPELLDRDIASCRVWSYEKFPPRMHENIGVNYPLSNTSTSVNSALSTPGISVQTKDINEKPRELAFEKCMMDNEWKLVAH